MRESEKKESPFQHLVYLAVFFFFAAALAETVVDAFPAGVEGRESLSLFASAFWTSSIPRFYNKRLNIPYSGMINETTEHTFPLGPLVLASSTLTCSASFSIMLRRVLHLLCNSCGLLLLKNQSNLDNGINTRAKRTKRNENNSTHLNTGNSLISLLILSYTSSHCIP